MHDMPPDNQILPPSSMGGQPPDAAYSQHGSVHSIHSGHGEYRQPPPAMQGTIKLWKKIVW